jgi:hypothetical protein
MHTPNGIENNIDCAIAAYAPFEGNRSLVTLEMYNIRWVHTYFTAV